MDVSLCRFDDIGQIQEFIARAFRPDHVLATDRLLLTWQFRNELPDEAPSILVARIGEEIVGMQGISGHEFVVRGRKLRGAWLANLATLPEWRRFGVGMRLLMAPIRMNYDVLLSVGLSDAVYPLMPTLGYATLDSVPRQIGIINRNFCLEIGGKQLPQPLVGKPSHQAGFERLEGPVPPEWDQFWLRDLLPTFVGTSRTAGFLNWRYVEHPRFRYDIRLLRRHGKPVALVVLRNEPISGTTMNAIRLVEILGDPDSLRVLLVQIFAEMDRETVAFIDWYGTAELPSRVLVELGFTQTAATDGPSLPNRLAPVETKERAIRAAFRWNTPWPQIDDYFFDMRPYLTKGDNDMDRPN